MARALVLPPQGAVLDVAELAGVHVGHLEVVGELVELLLLHLPLVDDDGVVEVAALDEVGLEQGHDVAHEDEGAGGGYLLAVGLHLVEGGELAVHKLALEGAHCRDAELLVGEDGDHGSALVLHLYLVADDVVVFLGVLLLDAHALDFLHIHGG